MNSKLLSSLALPLFIKLIELDLVSYLNISVLLSTIVMKVLDAIINKVGVSMVSNRSIDR